MLFQRKDAKTQRRKKIEIYFSNLFASLRFCVFAFIFCLLSSCGKTCFTTDHISGEHGSSRLVYHAPDPVNGIDFEILKTKNGSNLYLIVHSRPVSQAASAVFNIDGHIHQVALLRHEGGQRMLVADAEILEILRTSKQVHIEVEGYTARIDGSEFEKYYQKMQKPFFMQNPFRLPY